MIIKLLSILPQAVSDGMTTARQTCKGLGGEVAVPNDNVEVAYLMTIMVSK